MKPSLERCCISLLTSQPPAQPGPSQGYSLISNSDSSQSSHGGYEPSPEAAGQQKSIETKRQQLYKEGALRRAEGSPARLVSALSGEDSAESSMRQQVAKQQQEITRLKVSYKHCGGGGGGDARD